MIHGLETVNVSWRACEITWKPSLTHTHKIPLITHKALAAFKGAFSPHFVPPLPKLVFFYHASWHIALDTRHGGRLPGRRIDLSSRRTFKAEGMRGGAKARRLFFFNGGLFGACLGLFPVSSDCFFFH